MIIDQTEDLSLKSLFIGSGKQDSGIDFVSNESKVSFCLKLTMKWKGKCYNLKRFLESLIKKEKVQTYISLYEGRKFCSMSYNDRGARV